MLPPTRLPADGTIQHPLRAPLPFIADGHPSLALAAPAGAWAAPSEGVVGQEAGGADGGNQLKTGQRFGPIC